MVWLPDSKKIKDIGLRLAVSIEYRGMTEDGRPSCDRNHAAYSSSRGKNGQLEGLEPLHTQLYSPKHGKHLTF